MVSCPFFPDQNFRVHVSRDTADGGAVFAGGAEGECVHSGSGGSEPGGGADDDFRGEEGFSVVWADPAAGGRVEVHFEGGSDPEARAEVLFLAGGSFLVVQQ